LNLQGARIYVAGHTGLVGSAVVRALRACGHGEHLVLASHAQLDLTRQAETETFLAKQRPDLVVLAAARVGGIGGQPHAEMLRDNLAIAHNVLEGAARAGCKRLVFLGSSCIYPRLAPQPITEDALLTGSLEPTNRGYAVAKIAGLEMARAYAAAPLLDTVSLMPTNLYGPGDTYDLQRAHVLPAMIRRLHDAKQAKAPSVTLWGSGSPLREFLHADDLAQGVLLALERDELAGQLLNVGSGEAGEVSIRKLAEIVARVVGYEGEIVWDATKPDGTPRKLLDSSRMLSLGWAPRIGLEEGIGSTYAAWAAEPRSASVAVGASSRPQIVAVTSLSPAPASAARQRGCVESWIAAGCEVLALQASQEEIARLGGAESWPGVAFAVVESSKVYEPAAYIPISRMVAWAAEHRAGATLLLLNADCELAIARPALEDLAARHADGCVYLVRHEVHGDGREERHGCGVDGFLFHTRHARAIRESEILCMGKPAWDWAIPMFFVRAKIPLYSPTYRVLLHHVHPLRWNMQDHKRGCDEATRLTESRTVDAIYQAFTRAMIPIAPPATAAAPEHRPAPRPPPAEPRAAGAFRPIGTHITIDSAIRPRPSRRLS